MPTKRNSPCPCGSGKKFKKCCLNRTLGEDALISQDFYSSFNQAIPFPIGSPDDNSDEFQQLEDWANRYLSAIDVGHPLFAVLSDHLCTHSQIIDLARNIGAHDYLSGAEPLYTAWRRSRK